MEEGEVVYGSEPREDDWAMLGMTATIVHEACWLGGRGPRRAARLRLGCSRHPASPDKGTVSIGSPSQPNQLAHAARPIRVPFFVLALFPGHFGAYVRRQGPPPLHGISNPRRIPDAEGEIRTPEGLPPVAFEATALSGLGYLGTTEPKGSEAMSISGASRPRRGPPPSQGPTMLIPAPIL